jgi:large subunit ribosomal protein L9
MPQELILLDDVEDLGEIGQTVRVADGYARNYLLPRGLAAKATPGAMRQLEARKVARQERLAAEIASAEELAEQLAEKSVTIAVQVNEENHLYGSVTEVQIKEALDEMHLPIERRQIKLEEPLKELGVYEVPVKLHQQVTATLKVWVVKA